jgi:hypothetical protein
MQEKNLQPPPRIQTFVYSRLTSAARDIIIYVKSKKKVKLPARRARYAGCAPGKVKPQAGYFVPRQIAQADTF